MARYTLPVNGSQVVQGVVTHDERIGHANFDTTNSVYTEADPRPSQPTPGANNGFMQLEATGTTPAALSLDIHTVKEGAAVGGNEGGRYAFKGTTEAATHWRGSLEYNKLTPASENGLVGLYEQPSALQLNSGDLLVVGNYAGTSIRGARRSLADGTWGSQFTAHTSTWAAGSSNAYGTTGLVQVPSGRVLLFYTYPNTESGGDYVRIGMVFSDDDGDTWTQGALEIVGYRELLSAGQPRKMSVLYHRGYLSVLLSTGVATYVGEHLVSGDLGASFTLVETLDGSTQALSCRDGHLFANAAGEVLLVYHQNNGTLATSRKASPYSRFQDNPDHGTSLANVAVDLSLATTVMYAMAGTQDAQGNLWIYYRAATNLGEWKCVHVSADTLLEIESRWTHNDASNPYQPVDFSIATMYFAEAAIAPHGEAFFMVSTVGTPTTSTLRAYLSVFKLGGYTSVDWKRQTFGEMSGAGGYQVGYLWHGVELPGNLTWLTLTSTGTTTETVGADGVAITTAASSTHWWQSSLSTTNYPRIVMWSFKSDGITGAPTVGVNLYSGTTRVSVRYTDSQVSLYDLAAAATVGSAASIDTTVEREYLLYTGDLAARLWHRLPGEQVWTEVASSSSLTAGAAAGSLEFGVTASGAGHAADCTWRWLGGAVGIETDDPALDVLVQPSGLQGHPFAVAGTYLTGGLFVPAKGSSAYRGDTWTAATAATYGVRNLDPQRSPGSLDTYRSADDTTQVELVWELNGGSSTRFLGDHLGWFMRSNIRTAELYLGSPSPGTYQLVGTLDAEGNFAPASGTLSYSLDGNTIYPASATLSQQYALMDGVDRVELAWTGGTGTSPAAFNVQRNREGLWSTAAPTPWLQLEDNSDNALADIAAGTATTVKLWTTETLTLVYNVSAKASGAGFTHVKLVIPAQETAEGYFEIKTLLIGPIHAFGKTPGWGSIRRLETNREVLTSRSGRRRARKLGRSRRVAEFSWTSGWNAGQTMGQISAAPDYLSPNASVSEAWGVRADPRLPEQLAERTEGFTRPVVYVTNLPDASGTSVESTTLTEPDRFLYGLITSNVSRQHLLGDEASNPLVSINQLVLSEEV